MKEFVLKKKGSIKRRKKGVWRRWGRQMGEKMEKVSQKEEAKKITLNKMSQSSYYWVYINLCYFK